MKIIISTFILLCLFGCSNRLATTDSPKTSDKEPINAEPDTAKEPPNTTTNNPQVILLDFTTIAKESYSGATKKENVVITNKNTWEDLWNKIYSIQFPKPKAPNIDFEKEIVIGVMAGEFSTGGYDIEIIELKKTADEVEITVKTRSPGPTCGVTTALTQPLHLVKITKTEELELVFSETNHITNCKP